MFVERYLLTGAGTGVFCERLHEQGYGGTDLRHLLNTLYITSEDVFLALDSENVVAKRKNEELARYPLHVLESIITFSYVGASPALMGACAERNIGLAFCTPRGKFLARISGTENGNVLLRRTQYRMADDEEKSCDVARNMILGKLYNCRWVLDRALRDHSDRVDEEVITNSVQIILKQTKDIQTASTLDSLRGFEGVGASAYFNSFDQMILRDKDNFYFRDRNRRPPRDNVNAMLSFAYSMLANDCANALESVGLDSYVGFMHRDRPGRKSLALDIMEELRPVMADRFVLSAVNNRVIQNGDFLRDEEGGIRFTDNGKKQFLKAWQEKKKESITHPYLQEKVAWGLVPYVQALLLARYIRHDLDGYPPFLWK